MILYNANLVTMWPSQPIVDGALLAIEGKSIVDFGKMGKLIDRYDDGETLDVGGRVVVPGMIDAHARLTRRLGVGKDVAVHELERALDPSAVYAGASVALLDAVRSGITTVFAFHSSPSCVNGGGEELSRAFTDVGVRGSVSHAVSAKTDVNEAITENESQLARSSEMLRGRFGLQVSHELDEKHIVRCAEKAAELDAAFHVVVAETRDELDACLSHWGATPIGRLEKLGFWNRQGFLVRGRAPFAHGRGGVARVGDVARRLPAIGDDRRSAVAGARSLTRGGDPSGDGDRRARWWDARRVPARGFAAAIERGGFGECHSVGVLELVPWQRRHGDGTFRATSGLHPTRRTRRSRRPRLRSVDPPSMSRIWPSTFFRARA